MNRNGEGHEQGFGFIPNLAIVHHVSEPHREHAMQPVVVAHPELLDIGIDPNPVVVAKGDQLELIECGKSYSHRNP
jgi:cyanophycinase